VNTDQISSMISASVIAHDRRILPISYTIKITWPCVTLLVQFRTNLALNRAGNMKHTTIHNGTKQN